MPRTRTFRETSFGGRAARAAAARRAQAASRTARVLKARSTNKAVARIQRKAYVPKLVKNTASIRVLAKQVRALQRSKIGPVQSVSEAWNWTWISGSLGATYFRDQRPILFCAHDFIDPGGVRAPIYYSQDNSLTQDTVGQLPGTASTWQRHVFPGTGEGVGADDFNFWFKTDDNHASQEIYLPLSTNITFQFSGKMFTQTADVRFRIDVIRQKKMMTVNTDRRLQLPDAIQGLGNMISDDMLNRNRFNKEYFEVQQTKYITVKPPPAAINTTAASVDREVNLYIPFKHHMLKPDIDAEGSSNDHPAFYKNCDPRKLVWVLISTDMIGTPHPDLQFKMAMKRTNRWRDQHGTD